MDIRKRNPFQEIDHVQGEEHPIDMMVREQPAVKVLARKIRAATERLDATLGDNRSSWIALETLLNDHRLAREEVVFNTGFEYGHAAGEAKSLRLLKGESQSDGYREFADHLRDVTIQSGLPASLGIVALVEIAWAMALGLASE